MFVINTGNLELRLEVVPAASLLLHEEVIPDQAENLVLEFRNWANLQNPVIVDDEYMVLDGHHRASVFRELGFRHILVCRLDYLNAAVQLRYWFRRLGRVLEPDSFRQLVEEVGGTLQQVDNADTLRKLWRENRFQCGIQQSQFFALLHFRNEVVNDAVSAYRVVETIQKRLVEEGKRLEYIPCQAVEEARFCQELRADELIIWTPRISKKMVVDAVKKNKRFTPKATRHLIPARPLNVNMPIALLREPMPLEEINGRLMELLNNKKMRRFGPGQIVNGRYYEEALYVFFDETG